MRCEKWALSLLLVAAAVVAFGFGRLHPVAPRTARLAPEFSSVAIAYLPGGCLPGLSASGPNAVHFTPGNQPLFIALTAIGCQACRNRVVSDRQAYNACRIRHVTSWNVLVYATPDSANAFLRDSASYGLVFNAPDQVVLDDGKIAIGQLNASDSTCWILIDKRGRIVYQAGPDLDSLKAALSSLQ